MGKKVLNNLAYAIPHTEIYDFLMRNKENTFIQWKIGVFLEKHVPYLQWVQFLLDFLTNIC